MEQTCASPRRSRGQRRPPAPSSQARHRLRQVQRRISSRSSKCERSLAASVRRVQHWHLHYHAQPACHKRAACLYTRPTAAPMRALTWCATKGASAHRGAGRETRCGLSGFLVLRHANFVVQGLAISFSLHLHQVALAARARRFSPSASVTTSQSARRAAR